MSNHVCRVARRNVLCYFCNEFFEERHLSEHMTHCASVLEECSNKCGVYVPRKHLEGHQKLCAKRMSTINPTKNIGNSMWKEKVFSILTLLRIAIDHGEKERIHLHDAFSRNLNLVHSQQESLVALRMSIAEAVEQAHVNNSLLSRRLDNLEVITENAQHGTSVSFQQISEQLKLFEEELISERNKHEGMLNNWFKELKDLKTFIAKEGVRVSDIWQEQTQRINDLKLELEMRCKDSKEWNFKYNILSMNMDGLLEEILEHSKDITSQKTDLKSLKFQTKENLKYVEELIAENSKDKSPMHFCACTVEKYHQISTNGHIIWRINDYSEEMNKAKKDDHALYSPIFFNKEYGYALRMKLFLNGKGQWKDRHIIGCLRVENSEWDPLLDWPCVLKASVVLRDQDNPANDVRKVVKTIGKQNNDDLSDPDRKSDLYMFIPHTTLSRYPGLTKNNVVFFDIQVRDVKTSVSTMSLVVQ